MKTIEQLQEEIHILYVFNLILDKFGMDEESEFIFNKLKEKEKKLDAMLDDKLYYIKKVFFKFYEDEKYKFLNLYTIDNKWTLYSNQQAPYYKNQFTMFEIVSQDIFDSINWDEFELVPVEEEDKNETIWTNRKLQSTYWHA